MEADAAEGGSGPRRSGYGVRATLRGSDARSGPTIGHQEVGAWVACALMDEGRAVGADMEDWYSEDLLPEARVGRPVGLLRSVRGATRPARPTRDDHVRGASAALADAYGGPPPTVVYNAFPWSERDGLDGVDRDREGPLSPVAALGIADDRAGARARNALRSAARRRSACGQSTSVAELARRSGRGCSGLFPGELGHTASPPRPRAARPNCSVGSPSTTSV